MTSRARCQRALSTVALALVVAASPWRASAAPRAEAPAGSAGDSTEDAPAPYQGAFWAVQLHSGVMFRHGAGPGESPAPVLGLSARVATLLSLLDVQLTWLTAAWEATAESHAPTHVRRHSLGVALHLHPLFMRHLENDATAFWLGGIYLSVGGDLDLVDLDRAGVEPAFGFHIGAGTDIPLGDVDRGWGIWLGLSYRLKFLGVHGDAPGLGDFDEHAFLLTLAYRNNDIGFARFPRPAELDDREPPPR